MNLSPGHEPAGRMEKVRGVVTSNDIARLAGVSRATVSRVLNGSEHTSPEARERVRVAIAQTGYVPDAAARSLVGQHSHTIALSLFSADAQHMLSFFACASKFFYHDLSGASRRKQLNPAMISCLHRANRSLPRASFAPCERAALSA